MPTYEYLCASCGHRYEMLQSITEKPQKSCPVCAKAVQRLIGSGTGLMFKGSGFYETDYKRGSSGGNKSASAPKKNRAESAPPAKNPTE